MKHQSRIPVLILLLGAAGSAAAGESDLVPPVKAIKRDRPRLLLRPTATSLAISLDQLRDTPRDAAFRRLLAQITAENPVKASRDAYLATVDNRRLNQIRSQPNPAGLALAYLLTGEKSYADRGVARMRRWQPPPPRSKEQDPFAVYFGLRDLALAYDWLHDYPGFTVAIKAEVRGRAARLLAEAVRDGDDHVFHNFIWMRNGGAMLWALAAAGDDPETDALLERLRRRFNDHLFPAMRHLDGAPGEPMGYWSQYCLSPCVLVCLAVQSAFESNVIGTIRATQNDWLARQLDTLVMSTLPDMRFVPWGDLQRGSHGGVTHDVAGTIEAMTWALRSPHGRRLSNWLAWQRGPDRFFAETAVFHFLYGSHLTAEPAAPPLTLLAGNSQGGQFLARSGWGAGATVVGFRCTDYYGDHNHHDQGSFFIYRNGLLALDAGRYRFVRGRQQRTDAHNTLLFGGRGQTRTLYQEARSLEEFKHQRECGAMYTETGNILFFKATPEWSAVAGEFGDAYPSGVVDRCIRQLLFIRPGTVLIVDHASAPPGQALGDIAWLLHVPSKARIVDGVVTAANGTSYLRCRSLTAQRPGLKVDRSQPTQLSIQPRVTEAQRITFTYRGEEGIRLVHMLDVGDGDPPREMPEVTCDLGERGITVRLNGRTCTFASTPPFTVSVSGADHERREE